MKKFYHKPTKTILTQTDWNNPDFQGDFTFITSEALVEQSSDPYVFETIALLKDCEEIIETEITKNGCKTTPN